MRYSDAEVSRLVSHYELVREVADTDPAGLRLLILMADTTKALDALDIRGWTVVLLCGLLGLPQVEAARLMETSPRNVSRWLADAYEDLTYYINGGT